MEGEKPQQNLPRKDTWGAISQNTTTPRTQIQTQTKTHQPDLYNLDHKEKLIEEK